MQGNIQENVTVKDIKQVVMENYLPYAISTIKSRALPYIDGLKPVHRKILYTMFKMGLLNGGKTKSANIVGQTMKLHPHGDSAIYESIVRMTIGNEALMTPYVDSKGNFGKVYSRDMAYAASRYTEAKLADICRELFDGIEENAVDFVDNYDATQKEPMILPAKFPSILVNTSAGIAVGMSSNVASYNLKNVCMATIGVLKGEISTVQQLHEVLGAPDFPTGGIVHNDRREFISLLETGKGSVTTSSVMETYNNEIIVREIPYKTSIENIIESIEEQAKNGELKEIQDVKDGTDLHGLKITISLKRGVDVNKVIPKLFRLTPLRSTVGLNNNLIFDGEPIQCGALDIINMWIKFRVDTITRIYNYRLDKAKEKEHLLEAWEKIGGRLNDVIDIIVKNDENKAFELLMNTFNMSEKQADNILDVRTRELTTNKMAKKLQELAEIRVTIKQYQEILDQDKLKIGIMVSELSTIASKYGTDRKSRVLDWSTEEVKEVVVDDREAYVYVTNQGFIKRVENIKGYGQTTLQVFTGDFVTKGFNTKNNEYILVFMYNGTVHKIPVNSIDSSKGNPKDSIAKLIEDTGDILLVMASDGFNGHVNIVYSSGRGHCIKTAKFAGNRSKYISAYEAGTPQNLWCTEEDKFFLITRKKRAAFTEVMESGLASPKIAFKVARVPSDDSIFGIQPLSKVPDIASVDLSIYRKGYCVNIKHKLWNE